MGGGIEIDSKYRFGYPRSCRKCDSSWALHELRVRPFYKAGSSPRLMLIGQDPTIFNKQQIVEEVLMLDKDDGSLKKWILDILGENNFKSAEIYATNLVKCTFSNPPSTQKNKKFLNRFFAYCKKYLEQEILTFAPDLVISFGEKTHENFLKILDDKGPFRGKMKVDFKINFQDVSVKGKSFKYSPCLHIKTFRVAETYGEAVKAFKKGVATVFKTQTG